MGYREVQNILLEIRDANMQIHEHQRMRERREKWDFIQEITNKENNTQVKCEDESKMKERKVNRVKHK